MQGRCGHEMGGGSQQRDCTSAISHVVRIVHRDGKGFELNALRFPAHEVQFKHA